MADLGNAFDTQIDAITGIADDAIGWGDEVQTLLTYFRSDNANNPFGTAALVDTGTGSGNVPLLDSNGDLDTSVIPNLSTDILNSGTLGVGRGGTGQTTLNGVKTWLGLDADFDTLMGLDITANNGKLIGIVGGNFAAVDAPSGGTTFTGSLTTGSITLWSAATVPESSAARLIVNRGSPANYADAEFRWNESDRKFELRIPDASTGPNFSTYDVFHSGTPASAYPFTNQPLPTLPDQTTTQTNYVLRYTSRSILQWDQDRSFILPSLRGSQDSFAFIRANQAGTQLTTVPADSVRGAIGAVPCLTGGTTNIDSSSTDLVVNSFNVVDSDAVTTYNLSSGGNFGSNEPGIGSRMAIVGKSDNTANITVSLGANAPGAASVVIKAGDVAYFEKCARTSTDGTGTWLIESIVRREDAEGTSTAFDGNLTGDTLTLRSGETSGGQAHLVVNRGGGMNLSDANAEITWLESSRSWNLTIPAAGGGNSHPILHGGSVATDFPTAIQNRFLPAPTSQTGDSGKVAALNAQGTGYELVAQSGGGSIMDVPEEIVDYNITVSQLMVAGDVDKYVSITPNRDNLRYVLNNSLGTEGDKVWVYNHSSTRSLTVAVGTTVASTSTLITLSPSATAPFGKIQNADGSMERWVVLTAFNSPAENRLLPTPTSDTDDAGKVAALNSAATGYELVEQSSGGSGRITERITKTISGANQVFDADTTYLNKYVAVFPANFTEILNFPDTLGVDGDKCIIGVSRSGVSIGQPTLILRANDADQNTENKTMGLDDVGVVQKISGQWMHIGFGDY